ncbi:MAG: MFS transporter [Chloroflexota bacterium]|nr:MFS transporter [Chloroflexota bacterium]
MVERQRGPGRRVPLIALLSADGISAIGNELTALAVPWLVLETTGSAARAGLVVAVGTAAGLLGGLFGGAIVDRLGHKRASIIADLASGVTVALIPLIEARVGLAFWHLLTLVFLGALLDTPGMAARQSLFPDVARLARFRLDRTNTASQIVYRFAGLLGPLVAGLLIALLGPAPVLWVDAATFLLSAGLVALAVPGRAVARRVSPIGTQPTTTYWGEIKEGLAFIRGDRVIVWLVAGFGLGNLLAEPVYAVVLPVYANQIFGSAFDLGIVFAGLAIGSLIGNGLFLALAPRLPPRATIVTGFAVRALSFWLLVPVPPLPVVSGSIVVNAIFLEPTNPVWMTIRQERVPAQMRGRVFGALTALGAGSRSLGIVTYGLLLEGIGLQSTLLVLAAVNVLPPLVLWLAPPLRDLKKIDPRHSA